jgi:hypothetical protein
MANLTQLESDEIDYDPNNLLDTLIKHLHLKNDAALPCTGSCTTCNQ